MTSTVASAPMDTLQAKAPPRWWWRIACSFWLHLALVAAICLSYNWTVAHGIPTVTLGAGQRHIHMPAEEVDLRHFTLACRLAVELATAPEADASA